MMVLVGARDDVVMLGWGTVVILQSGDPIGLR